MKRSLALAAGLALSLCSFASGQTLEVVPNHILSDESAVIHVTGLAANERVTIQAELRDGAGEMWSSSADFVADSQGAIDVSKQAPVSGSYKEVSSMGLIWSMMPKEKRVKGYRSPDALGAQEIELRLMRRGQQAASAQLEELFKANNVKSVKLMGTLHGVLIEPASGGPYPGVLVVGGSEGGIMLHRAAWLASHGFAALALAYFRYDDLPPRLEAIPLEYFGTALEWMREQPEIAGNHIGVMGTSRGGELALQLGSMYPVIKAVVAYVPANTLNPACCGQTTFPYAWTWKGSPLAWVRPGSRRNPEAVRDATIHVENTRGPVLMISGDDDGVWQSSRMADEVLDRLKDAHFSYKYENLKYHHAGHTAGNPLIIPAWRGRTVHPLSGKEVEMGGTVEGNAHSSIDSIPKVLEFLQESLGSAEPQPKQTSTTETQRNGENQKENQIQNLYH